MNNFFTRLLEIIWLIVGIVAAIASVNSFVRNDTRNGLIMLLCALIGVLMFFARRKLRLRRRNENR
ncbi:MAG TPA: hypothetical protein VHO90_18120 [Bacteroidales bacterium]|nr:hypothetical protein [Bacteroidales bacterium]